MVSLLFSLAFLSCSFAHLIATGKKVLAASSLLSITHSLKLLFLLSDEREIVQGRAQALEEVEKEVEEAKEKAKESWEVLVNTGNT